MIDELFNRLNQYELLDWGVIFLGVTGVPGIAERLSHSLVENFANTELEKISANDPLLDMIVELATNNNISPNELRENLETICHINNIDLEKSRRKWRCVSLENIITDIDPDLVYGLINLSEFWTAWGWPTDSPTSMRTDHEISPQNYHSESNYEYVIKNHRDWLVSELALLHK